MNEITYARRNRFSLILFFVFSIIFVVSGIPGIYKESVLYGSGYFQSWTFFKTLLTFVPFVLFTVYIFFLIRRRYVLVFNERGILDQRYVWGRLLVPWDHVFSAEVKKERKWYYLYIRIKSNSKEGYVENTNPVGNTIKIPLKNIDCDLLEIENFITAMINK